MSSVCNRIHKAINEIIHTNPIALRKKAMTDRGAGWAFPAGVRLARPVRAPLPVERPAADRQAVGVVSIFLDKPLA